MDFTRRLGRPEDADHLAFDCIARVDRRRADLIRRKLQDGACWVAESGAQLLGYACRGTFFHHDFLELLYVDAAHRRQGVGRALIDAIESTRRTQNLFTSTNESNAAMRAMLARPTYEPSGVIHSLDLRDPELVFVKKFVTPAGRDPSQ